MYGDKTMGSLYQTRKINSKYGKENMVEDLSSPK